MLLWQSPDVLRQQTHILWPKWFICTVATTKIRNENRRIRANKKDSGVISKCVRWPSVCCEDTIYQQLRLSYDSLGPHAVCSFVMWYTVCCGHSRCFRDRYGTIWFRFWLNKWKLNSRTQDCRFSFLFYTHLLTSHIRVKSCASFYAWRNVEKCLSIMFMLSVWSSICEMSIEMITRGTTCNLWKEKWSWSVEETQRFHYPSIHWKLQSNLWA